MNHHHHDHPGHHEQQHDTHFDARAATWDETSEHVERARAVVAAIAEHVELGPDTSVLDYGAGTGLVAQGLSSSVGSLTLADTSAGMREVIAAKIAVGELPASTRIWDLDLGAGQLPSETDESFDLVVAVMVLHHMGDPSVALGSFARLLTPGGTLCITDLDPEDGNYHSTQVAVHHGFDRTQVAAWLNSAGLRQVRFIDGPPREREGKRYSSFIAFAS